MHPKSRVDIFIFELKLFLSVLKLTNFSVKVEIGMLYWHASALVIAFR